MLSPFRPRLPILLRRTPKLSSTPARRLHAFQTTPLKINTLRSPSTRVSSASALRTKAPSLQTRHYSSKPVTADTLIEELQDLYEIAKDEFEIATESTDGGTIYAASDRDAARDALNDLCATYFLYTHKEGEEDTGVVLRSGEKMTGSRLLSGEGVVMGEGVEGAEEFKTGFDGEIPIEVKDEVRRRVGQRMRELRNAVELLEERAMAE